MQREGFNDQVLQECKQFVGTKTKQPLFEKLQAPEQEKVKAEGEWSSKMSSLFNASSLVQTIEL